jgi:putative endonuclease
MVLVKGGHFTLIITGSARLRYNRGMADSRQERGRLGEAATLEFLERRGYAIVDANVRLTGPGMPRGELDVIAWDGGTLCFVEVKTRRAGAAVGPEEAVTPAKQRQIARLALAYAARCGLLDGPEDIAFRFDVVCVRLSQRPGGARIQSIELIRGAFLAPEEPS